MRTDWRKKWRLGRKIYYFDSGRDFETEEFAWRLHGMICDIMEEKGKNGVLVLCIGTDRSTGDSLGPLTGYKLKEQQVSRIQIIGTLERPVHAMNLEQSMAMIRLRYPNHVIIAVDA